MSSTPDKTKALLGDLGKATMRGIRKCHKCGTINGTRGISCKNPHCDVIFKEKEKRRVNADAVKIITGSSVQIYSVRLRDRGPDYRGFVQLPIVQDMEGNPAEAVDMDVLAGAARCYVEACPKNYAASHGIQTCMHIQAAIQSNSEAKALPLKNSVINSLEVSREIREFIWFLATDTQGPLVQRVSKNSMVVKCKQGVKHPLGFLHFSVSDARRNGENRSFQCSCKAFRSVKSDLSKEDLIEKRCVHFFACVCAFASDDKLAKEFKCFINVEMSTPGPPQPQQPTSDLDLFKPDHVITDHMALTGIDDGEIVFGTEEEPLSNLPVSEYVEYVGLDDTEERLTEVVVEQEDGAEYGDEPVLKRIKLVKDDDQGHAIVEGGTTLLALNEDGTPQRIVVHSSGGDVSLSADDSAKAILTTPTSNMRTSAATQQSARTVMAVRRMTSSNVPVEEQEVTQSFMHWLSSVTERINLTMHYQFDGMPDALVFHAPQKFFDCLQQRISCGRKKRLPNATVAFSSKDALPLGTFTKYTWHITNIMHVKQIFDTPTTPLELSRSFVQNKDGSFDLYEVPSVSSFSHYILHCRSIYRRTRPITCSSSGLPSDPPN